MKPGTTLPHTGVLQRPWVQGLVSLALLYHLTAVLLGPNSIPPFGSLIAERLRPYFRDYIAATFLNHGYKFFAPEPGPSHLIRYVVERPDGTRVTGILPDRQGHWPRLMYHRHFMLTEFINDGRPVELWPAPPGGAGEGGGLPAPLAPPPLVAAQPAAPTPTGGPPLLLAAPAGLAPSGAGPLAGAESVPVGPQEDNRMAERYIRSYARHLLHVHGAERVTLYYRMHLLPPIDAVRAGRRLDEPEWYRERPLGSFTRADFPGDDV